LYMPITAQVQFTYQDIFRLVLQLSAIEKQQLIVDLSQQTALQDIEKTTQEVENYMPLANLHIIKFADLETQNHQYKAIQQNEIVGLLADEPSLINFGK
jgi:hypothetical protein